jgi:hypothetical protein
MLKTSRFRFLVCLVVAACGGSKDARPIDTLPQQSILADANKPSIYNAGTGPIVSTTLDAGRDLDESANANSEDQNAADDDDDAVKPLAIPPGVEESAVRVGLDIFTAGDGAPFIAAIDKHIAPERLEDSPVTADDYKAPTPPGAFGFRRVPVGTPPTRLLFSLRYEKRGAAIVVSMSPDNRVIVPVEWLRAVISFKGVDDKDSRAWYVGVSRRLAVAGRSSGIVIFDNGTAAGVLVEAQGEGDDLTVMAHTEFFPAGGFDAPAWGPVLKNVKGVATKNGDGHAGIDARDLLSQALHFKLPHPH